MIEIVTHAYATKLPHYAAALSYQLSSLVHHRPRVETVITVCYWQGDKAVCDVMDYHSSQLSMRRLPLATEGELGRRAIGRNLAALGTKADVVWFADCDMLFGEGCLDALASSECFALVHSKHSSSKGPVPLRGISMVYPNEVQICRDHALGDRLLRSNDPSRDITADPSLFVRKRYTRAIGGAQIVPGSLARFRGYLCHYPRWLRPAEVPFGDFRDDLAYRRDCQRVGDIAPLDLPSVFRLRHSTTSYQGAKQ